MLFSSPPILTYILTYSHSPTLIHLQLGRTQDALLALEDEEAALKGAAEVHAALAALLWEEKPNLSFRAEQVRGIKGPKQALHYAAHSFTALMLCHKWLMNPCPSILWSTRHSVHGLNLTSAVLCQSAVASGSPRPNLNALNLNALMAPTCLSCITGVGGGDRV